VINNPCFIRGYKQREWHFVLIPSFCYSGDYEIMLRFLHKQALSVAYIPVVQFTGQKP